MKMSLRLLAASTVFAFAGAAFAATPQASAAPAATHSMQAPAKVRTAQQQRMANCNKEATGKKGAERKAFMSSCLKGKAAAAPSAMSSAKSAQQEKMKACNAEAKTKAIKGAARKTFMSGCLKGGEAAPAAK